MVLAEHGYRARDVEKRSSRRCRQKITEFVRGDLWGG